MLMKAWGAPAGVATLYRFFANVDFFATDTFFEEDRSFETADRDVRSPGRRAVPELAAGCEAVLLTGTVFAPPIFFDAGARLPSISVS
jgi:hypothetical protein